MVSFFLYYHIKKIKFQDEYMWFHRLIKSFIENSFKLVTTDRTAIPQFTFFNRCQSTTNFSSSQVFKGMCCGISFRNFFLELSRKKMINNQKPERFVILQKENIVLKYVLCTYPGKWSQNNFITVISCHFARGYITN